MVILSIALGLCIVLFIAVRLLKPPVPNVPMSEIERRIKAGDEDALLLGERRRAAPLLLAVRTFAGLLLAQAANVMLWFLTHDVWISAIATVVIVVGGEWAVRITPAVRYGARLYAKIEPRLLHLYAYRTYFGFLPKKRIGNDEIRLHSEAELLKAVDAATFLDAERRALIHSALEFTGLTAEDAMSGRRSIYPVDKSEVLGPLLLDELYKTGKAAFVVTDGGLDDIVGVLKLERLTSLDMVDSPTVIKAMSPEVHDTQIDTPITDALAYLRSSRAPFLVVKDGEKTAGLLTMDNILRCLFEQ